MVEYTKEQFIELYKDLPEELKTAMESDRTVDVIEQLSDQEELDSDQHRAFVKIVGDVLIGLTKPSQFKKELELAGIKKKSAEKINETIQRFVFYPVRKTLGKLYQEEISATKRPVQAQGKKQQKEIKEIKVQKKKTGDKYREEIE